MIATTVLLITTLKTYRELHYIGSMNIIKHNNIPNRVHTINSASLAVTCVCHCRFNAAAHIENFPFVMFGGAISCHLLSLV